MRSTPNPPATTLRLFPDLLNRGSESPAPAGLEEASHLLGAPHYQSFWIGRVLEEGEELDLRWLVATVGEDALRDWVKERGGRQLSRRSRAFWSLLLGLEQPSPPPVVETLWPL